MSQTTERLRKKNKLVYLIRGKENGEPTWYYVLIDKLKLPLLQREQRKKGEDVHLDNFCEVIESGWGEEPPEEVKQRMLKTY